MIPAGAPRAFPAWSVALAAIFAATVPAAAQSGPLPVTLIDPSSGDDVILEAGPRALHVVFFATWCPPCLEEMRPLADLQARWEERGYRLVLIAVRTRHTRERLAQFKVRSEPPGRLLFDSVGGASRAFQASDLPTHVLIDASGAEVTRSPSLDAAFVERLERLIREGELERE